MTRTLEPHLSDSLTRLCTPPRRRSSAPVRVRYRELPANHAPGPRRPEVRHSAFLCVVSLTSVMFPPTMLPFPSFLSLQFAPLLDISFFQFLLFLGSLINQPFC